MTESRLNSILAHSMSFHFAIENLNFSRNLYEPNRKEKNKTVKMYYLNFTFSNGKKGEKKKILKYDSFDLSLTILTEAKLFNSVGMSNRQWLYQILNRVQKN